MSVKLVEKLTNNCIIYKWIHKNIEKDIIMKFRVEERDHEFLVKLIENTCRFMEYFLLRMKGKLIFNNINLCFFCMIFNIT